MVGLGRGGAGAVGAWRQPEVCEDGAHDRRVLDGGEDAQPATTAGADDPPVFVVGAPPGDPARWGFSADVPFPLDPDRWVVERQYSRCNPGEALSAFARRRREVLALFWALSPEQWKRGSIHPAYGRVTFEEWTAGMAAHDDNHQDQLARALDGRP